MTDDAPGAGAKKGWDLTDQEFALLGCLRDRSLTAFEISRGLRTSLRATDALLTHLTTTRMLSCTEETVGGERAWRYALTWRAWEELEREGGPSGRAKRQKNPVLRWVHLISGRHKEIGT